ncbi:multisubunit sodium/proton antiporter, MrpF subunit [Terribacillus aidingensis]|jgi:multicomponent Na+:H+ antiporter subunit F|uniref:Multisubunit sodium/proton antiporter, MrpF subunit n=1 Tax=Terribacillus aidingensis TaxID=586416 RepID=A0A285NPJ6_9BACI|nr:MULTISPECIES: Na(+)/H(+) antiporter subunit F1 [Terribacillus]QXE00500.1 Na(+)/H(+) antiporter subunit F1 [Terribacillus sp. DMT04]SNZ11138.1 multisubunit sodium/proton antiporter, MrpF subunit [Terribacillus aidingensis]
MSALQDDFASIVQMVSIICLIVLSVSIILLIIRVLKGPTNADRAVALDAIGVNIMAFAALLAIILVTPNFNDIVLLIGILLFIGTVAIAIYLEKGDLIDTDDN